MEDGRYVVMGSAFPVVVDLVTGKTVGGVPTPDGAFVAYTTVARGAEAGTYLAATEVRQRAQEGRAGPRGARARIYRLEMDDKGRLEVAGAVSEQVEGVIRSIAVSPAGEIAYARTMVDEDDRFFSFAGVVGRGEEWPVEDPYRLFWADETTLVFPSRAEPPWTLGTKDDGEKFIAGGGFLPTLDVATGVRGKVAVPPDLTSYGMVRLAGGRAVWATEEEQGAERVVSLVLYDGPTAIGTIYRATVGKVVVMRLDAGGERLLVGHEVTKATGDGMSDVQVDQQLVRLDLRPVLRLPVPERGERRGLEVPQQRVWQGDGELGMEEIAW
ncbi:hypothetical protein ACIBG7_30300 [Nonomuraea sp. NPDC050328]|uniref:hypothetical protein n=1 Tax=Nonomuraea sp. NPDC050328 TaxID=3364361 RepID=UPI00378F0CC4